MEGKVKFFAEDKGFGFIAADDGKEYFVHQSALPEGVRLNEGDSVSFDVEEGDRGPKAVNVQLAGQEQSEAA
jgi:cold shock protein